MTDSPMQTATRGTSDQERTDEFRLTPRQLEDLFDLHALLHAMISDAREAGENPGFLEGLLQALPPATLLSVFGPSGNHVEASR